MIKINIMTDGKKIADQFEKKNTTLLEVGITLLRLKQIEQELINLEFDDDVSIEENDEF